MSKYKIKAIALSGGKSCEFDLMDLMPATSKDGDVFYINGAAYVFCAIESEELSEAQQRIAKLESALRDIIAENPQPTLPYGYRVNEIAQNALAGEGESKK